MLLSTPTDCHRRRRPERLPEGFHGALAAGRRRVPGGAAAAGGHRTGHRQNVMYLRYYTAYAHTCHSFPFFSSAEKKREEENKNLSGKLAAPPCRQGNLVCLGLLSANMFCTCMQHKLHMLNTNRYSISERNMYKWKLTRGKLNHEEMEKDSMSGTTFRHAS